MAEGHGNALERFVTEDMNIPHATSIETDFHEADEPGGNNRTLTEIFSNHSPVSPELSMSANPPPNSSVRPARRPMNSRERRLMVLRRADYWHAFCSGTFSFLGVINICMGLIVMRCPLDPVEKVRPGVAILADMIFILLGVIGVLCCAFALFLAKTILYLF